MKKSKKVDVSLGQAFPQTLKEGKNIDKKIDKPAKLTDRQERFALAKVGGLSTRKAGLTAGYSKNYVEAKGKELDENVGIKTEIVRIFDRIGLTSEKLSKIEKKGLTKATIIKDGKELPDFRVRLGYAKHIRELRGELVPIQLNQTVVNVSPQQAQKKLSERMQALKGAENKRELTHKEEAKSLKVLNS